MDQGFGVIVAIILACVVVGVLAFSLGREGERDSKRASEYEKYADRRKGAYCVDLAGVSHAKCEIEQEEAAREAYNAERDLNAQRDMATWALAVFIISSITAGLTLWALWYVRRTLVATVAAVEETSRATWAMEQQNKIAEAGQRPWMAVDIKIENPRRTPEGFNFVLSVIFKNIGKTSAKNYKSSHDIIMVSSNNLIEVKKFFFGNEILSQP